MKNIFTILSFAAFSTLSFAQIKVLSLDLADANDTVRVSVALTANVNQISISGANATWNFSDLSPSLQRIEHFDAPNSFASPFNMLFNTFNTSFGKVNATFSNLNLMVISIEKAYDFLKKSTESYKQIGTGLTINNMPVPFLYSMADVIHYFPVKYQDEDSCDFQFGTGLPSLGYYGQTGKRVNEADAWGQLTTPYGTFDVLRVTSKIDITDTIHVSQFSFGTKFKRPTNYQYKWYAKNEKLPILEINGSYQGSNFVPTSIVYRDIYRPEIQQLSNKEEDLIENIELYPNPSKNTIHVSSPNATFNNYRILDISGKVVMTGNMAHQNNVTIATEHLNNGVYIFYANTEKGAIIKKFIKE